MDKNNNQINEKLKNSFDNIKLDINLLKNELNLLKNQLIKEKEENKLLKEKLSSFTELKPKISSKNEIKDKSSTGNKGVIHSFIHSFTSYAHPMHTKEPLKIEEIKDEIDRLFKNIPKQEFLVFLTLYQLEDDLKRPITYLELANKLSLTEGCIRTYTSNLLKRKLPLTKRKINNKIVELSINPHFHDLNLKQTLINIYYLSDIEQKKLLDIV